MWQVPGSYMFQFDTCHKFYFIKRIFWLIYWLQNRYGISISKKYRYCSNVALFLIKFHSYLNSWTTIIVIRWLPVWSMQRCDLRVINKLSNSRNVSQLRNLEVVPAQWNIWLLLVNGHTFVVKWRRLENDSTRSTDASECKHPEEEAIKYHWHVLPVLHNLQEAKRFFFLVNSHYWRFNEL